MSLNSLSRSLVFSASMHGSHSMGRLQQHILSGRMGQTLGRHAPLSSSSSTVTPAFSARFISTTSSLGGRADFSSHQAAAGAGRSDGRSSGSSYTADNNKHYYLPRGAFLMAAAAAAAVGAAVAMDETYISETIRGIDVSKLIAASATSSATTGITTVIDSVVIGLASLLPVRIAQCDSAALLPTPTPSVSIAALAGKGKSTSTATKTTTPSKDGLDGALEFVHGFEAQETLDGIAAADLALLAASGTVVAVKEEEAGGWWAYFKSLYVASLRFLRLFGRVLYCSTVISSALVVAPPLLLLNKSETLWAYVVACIEVLGPTYVKLAQWASSRPDLFSAELIAHLSKLQDQAHFYPLHIAQNTLSVGLGQGWDELLELDPKPIGAGCIAQVYRGFLRPRRGAPDEERLKVAVKVIHPHVEAMVKMDMQLLRYAAEALPRLFPQLQYLSLPETVDIFAASMIQQLDLREEARHLIKFDRNFREEVETVAFPRPIAHMVTRNVLVETYMEGLPISHYAFSPQYDKQFKLKISELACHAMLLMVFNHNFTHGDLHPGNILIQLQPGGKPRVVFLDCGIVTEAKHKHRIMLDVLLAMLKFDGREAGRLMLQESGRENAPGVAAFCEGVQAIVDQSRTERYFEHIGEYVARLCQLSYVHRVRMVPEFLAIAMAVKVSEGVALQLNPDLEMSKVAIPYVLKAQAAYVMEQAMEKLHR